MFITSHLHCTTIYYIFYDETDFSNQVEVYNINVV